MASTSANPRSNPSEARKPSGDGSRQLAEKYHIVSLEPADLRKLVEGAVDYARNIGLNAHRDYQKVKTIFGDIDPDESTQVFEYGHRNGKPHFIAGPNDAPFRCREILDTLERVCGPGGYDCTIPLHGGTSHQVNDVLRIDANGDA